MIQFPRRSVTRFFIPLIDVLTLLFCIFLLMPMVKPAGEAPEAANASAPNLAPGDAAARANLPGETQHPSQTTSLGQQNRERSESAKEREELERLRTEKINILQQRLFIRVLEIDPDTGKLFYREPDGVREIASQADALDLIARHKREAGSRELYYLFLFPRRLTGYPEQRQLERYDRWFKSVAHGTDNPLSERNGP
jgi:hypothetical protein